MRNSVRCFVGVFLAFNLVSVASAQSVTNFNTIMNNIIRGTPGVTSVSIPGAVRASASGTAIVNGTAGGLSIPVAVTAEASISASAIAKGAARVGMRAVPWVGTALVLNDIANAIKNSGISVCPPPDFFCKPGPDILIGWTTGSSSGTCTSASEGCDAETAGQQRCAVSLGTTNWTYASTTIVNPGSANAICRSLQDGHTTSLQIGRSGSGVKPGATGPASQDDLQSKMEADFQANQASMKALHDHMRAVQAANPELDPPMDVRSAPLTVTAPAVSTAPQTVSTETTPNADGNGTSTKTTTQQTTVTPSTAPSATPGNPQTVFPSTVTTTTTVVNNVTNVTNVTNKTDNIPSPPVDPQKLDLPTDYNREATQKAILQTLDGSTLPASPADQEARTATEVAKTDTNLDTKFKSLPDQFVPDKASWFSWVWTPPVGQCSASDYTGSVHGWTVAFDICPWVDKIREALGWLFAIFGALNIYGNLFKRDDK